MNKFKRFLIPVAAICLLLATIVGGGCAPQSLGERFDPSGNPFANRFSDVTDYRTATYIVAASDSVHKYEADYFCDGTNDHIQIQAALDALPATGGEVGLLDGTYNVEVTLNLDTNQTLRGCGRNTVLITSTALLIFLSAVGGAGTELTGIVIADLHIDGGAGSISCRGIHFEYVDHSFIENVYSRRHSSGGSPAGIYLVNSYFNIIADCICQGNQFGILLVNSNSNTCTGNFCQENMQIGLFCSVNSNHNIIAGNSCEGNTWYGIELNTNNNNTIIGNACQGNSLDGIFLAKTSNNTVTGNTCQGNDTSGINLNNDNSNNTVTGNTCQGNGSVGIWISSTSSNNTITGNTCRGNDREGIRIHLMSDNNTIVGNTCTENSQGADNTYDNIFLTLSSYNNIQGNTCRAPTIGTTLTVGEPIAETDIAVTNTAGFEVGMGVVIDLGGANVEYHRISAITAGAPGVITIDVGLTNAQGAGETIDVPEAQYGINISDDTCDKNVVVGNDLYDAGKTANFNDIGTCTIVQDDNREITPVQVKHMVYAQNTSGGNLTTGNVVSYEAAAAAVGFETPTAIGDPKVWGMLAEDIDNNAFGYIQTLGGTVLLDATNVGGGAIAIGDLLCTEVGSRARKAAAASDHVAFAIAMEACDAADCVINALLITPRVVT